MNALYGGFAAMAGLLVLGGAMKVVKPNETANALGALGLPRARVLVRIGGAVEALVGAAALAFGGAILVALVALSYLAFTAFVLAALRNGSPIGSCGCFGEVDAPPTWLHAALTFATASVAALVAGSGSPSLVTVLGRQPWGGVPFLVLCATAGYLAFLVMAVLPRTIAVVREVAR
jgi:hypothetical protein